jgi:hypothetical protein
MIGCQGGGQVKKEIQAHNDFTATVPKGAKEVLAA